MKTKFILPSLLFCYFSGLSQIKIPLSKPLVNHIFTADPSAHVFNGKFYIYPSHDIETGAIEDDKGNHFNMKDYHVLSMKKIGGKVKDNGVALDIESIPWAGRQLWAPDAAYKNGTYYLYFPLKDKFDIFKIGVATSQSPTGPFVSEPSPIDGSYSIDPAVFEDDDKEFYMYFGGIWGGQLQNWDNNIYDKNAALKNKHEMAFLPRVAKLALDMKGFVESPKILEIVGKNGKPFTEADNDKRFFEASWMHKHNGVYYFSYSTGDTHNICYATSDNPYGPFEYQGVILKPVQGWTNHHSIVDFKGKTYLFYHDTELSGKTHLRNIKMTELNYNDDGSIQTIDAYK